MFNRKIFSFFLAMLMLLMCVPGYVFAYSGEYKIEKNEFAVEVALGLGAINEFDAEKKVTVGEFKNAIDKLQTNDGLAELYFPNSKADANEIKFVDAAAVMCDILGYGVIFDSKNTDNTQMVLTAEKRGLLKGVSERGNETLTMNSLVNMFYNVLNAKALDTTYSSGGGYNAEITDKKYIEDVMNMAFIEGVVESTKFSSIKSESGTGDDTIVISGISYKCSIDNAEDYIGMKVRALADYNDHKKRILVLFDNGKAVTIDADDLDYASITKRNITYYNDKDRKKSISVSEMADVLYNYSLLMDWTAEDLKVKQGRLVCIDNNGDGRYDVVKIEEYKSMQVFSASVDSKKISDADGNIISIAKLIDDNYPIYEKGAKILPENIPVGSVVTYYLDKSGEVVRIYITTSDIVAGTVKTFKKNKNKILLDDKEYSYTDELKEKIELVDTGTVITATLNYYGEIAVFEETKDAYLYGYLLGFDIGKGLSNPRLRIFTQENEFKIYDTKTTIDINGTKMDATKAFEYNLDSGLWDEVGKIDQIIKYKVNSKNCVTSIRTATSYDVGQPERLLKEKDGVYTYFAEPQTICADTRLNNATKVFLIPTDLREETKFKYGTHNILGNCADYTCQVYDIDEDRYASVVVARIDPWGKQTINDIGGDVFMVNETGTFLNNRGEVSPMVTAHRIGETELTDSEIFFNSGDIGAAFGKLTVTSGTLKQGDIIMVANDETFSQEKGNLIIWYRPGETEPFEAVKQYWTSAATIDSFYADARCYAAGKVIKKVNNGVIINNKPEDTEEYSKWNRIIPLKSNTAVYILDKNRGEIVKGSVADLMPDDKIFSILASTIPTEIIIYRNF